MCIKVGKRNKSILWCTVKKKHQNIISGFNFVGLFGEIINYYRTPEYHVFHENNWIIWIQLRLIFYKHSKNIYFLTQRVSVGISSRPLSFNYSKKVRSDFMIAIPSCLYYHSIQFRDTLNKTFYYISNFQAATSFNPTPRS